MDEYMFKLDYIINCFTPFFLELVGPKILFNVSTTCKSYYELFQELYPGIISKSRTCHFYNKDPFNRHFTNDIPELGLVGLKCLPNVNSSIKRFCHMKEYRPDLVKIPNHLIVAIDKSGSTGTHCCEIENGPHSGNKTVLDVIKLFVSSIIDIIKSQPKLNISKITIITFDCNVKVIYDNMNIQNISSDVLSDINSNGGTNFNRMVRYVKENIKNKLYYNHKLLVLTDCNCNVDENIIMDLLKVNCNINTCFVPPGSMQTLKLINKYSMHSGIHEKLSIDFSRHDTVRSWCDFIGNVLSSEQVSIMEIDNDDDTRSIYNTSNVLNGYIVESIRPMYNIKDLKKNKKIKCYDFSGNHIHIISYKTTNNIMSHELFAICLKKMYNSIKKEFTKLQQDIIKYKNESITIKKYQESIKQHFKNIKYLKRQIFFEQNKDEIKKKCNLIGTWYKCNKLRKKLVDYVNKRILVKSIYVYKIQSIYRKYRIKIYQQFNYWVTNSPPRLKRSVEFNSRSIYQEQMCNIRYNNNQILQTLLIIKNTYDMLENKEKSIKNFDLKKNNFKFLIKKLNIIKKNIKDGIENFSTTKLINILNLEYDSIKLIGVKLVLKSGNTVVYTFLDKIKEYVEYSKIICHCSVLVDNIKKFIDEYDENIKINYNSYVQIYNAGIPNVPISFRQYSVPKPPPQLSRMVSGGMYNTPAMRSLRSVSGI
jgi:hypothetical protein